VAGKTYITTAVRDIAERKLAEDALRESEGKYRLLMEQASDGIHTYDPDGNILDTNSKFCEMLGYTRAEVLRLNVRDLIGPEELAAAPIRFDELRAGQTLLTERRLRRKDGTLLPVEISGRMIRDGVLQSIVRDISERKRAEEELRRAYDQLEVRVEERTRELQELTRTLLNEVKERQRAEETLRESEQRLRVALQTGNLGAWQLDLDTFELDSSPTCKANFGLPADAEFSYREFFQSIHPGDRASVRAAVERAARDGSDYHAEYRAVWPDGSTHWIVAHGRGIYAPEGEPLRMVGVTIDITERRRSEEARRDLLGRLVTAQEEERRSISRELHDQMGQQLAALLMGLKTLGADSYGRRTALDTLKRLEGITDELSREVHTLAWGLRPPALDDLGLETALYNYLEEWAEHSRVSVDFHSAGFEGGRLPLTHETAVYRIAQEALTNVAKHAGADRVSFILERRGDHVLAVIEDNGGGFDVEAATPPEGRGRRLGLLGIRERAELLGGTINVESAPGAGTTLFVRIPFDAGGGEGGASA
ncbi:MAG TPA: PAS domain S-box protein, partial [Pyrinomonadaceae bacterium]